MTRFRYTDQDGRTGEADSAYYAIAQAVGQDVAGRTQVYWNYSSPIQVYSQRGDTADVYAGNDYCGKLVNMG